MSWTHLDFVSLLSDYGEDSFSAFLSAFLSSLLVFICDAAALLVEVPEEEMARSLSVLAS